jgi:hypothetical protein
MSPALYGSSRPALVFMRASRGPKSSSACPRVRSLRRVSWRTAFACIVREVNWLASRRLTGPTAFACIVSEGELACQPESHGTDRGVRLRAVMCAAAPADSLRLHRERRLVSLSFASWNQLDGWLREIEWLRRAA